MEACFYWSALLDSGISDCDFEDLDFLSLFSSWQQTRICWTLELIASQRKKGPQITQLVHVKMTACLYHKGTHKLLSAVDQIT